MKTGIAGMDSPRWGYWRIWAVTVFLLSLLLGLGSVRADTLVLREGHPTSYVVQTGDTLWDISAKFLESPWLWPRIWQHNPDIDDPHLIYPGDRLTLIFVDGQPRLVRKPVVRLSPRARPQPHRAPIPTLPLSLLGPLLEQAMVLTDELLQQAGRVIGNNRQTQLAEVGQAVYVRDQVWDVGQHLVVYRRGEAIMAPNAWRRLGWQAVLVGSGVISEQGDPAKLLLLDSRREIRAGDLVLPMGEHNLLPAYFMPRAPWDWVEGEIIASHDGHATLGAYQVALLDQGRQDGLEPGHVLAVYQSGAKVLDSRQPQYYQATNWTERLSAWLTPANAVTLPPNRVGELMVFRTFEELSLALVLRSTHPLRIGDAVRSPDAD